MQFVTAAGRKALYLRGIVEHLAVIGANLKQ